MGNCISSGFVSAPETSRLVETNPDEEVPGHATENNILLNIFYIYISSILDYFFSVLLILLCFATLISQTIHENNLRQDREDWEKAKCDRWKQLRISTVNANYNQDISWVDIEAQGTSQLSDYDIPKGMEDFHITCNSVKADEWLTFLVCDGHHGSRCGNLVVQMLSDKTRNYLHSCHTIEEMIEALERSYKEVDEQVLALFEDTIQQYEKEGKEIDPSLGVYSGCVTGMININGNHMLLSGVGDCGIIICEKGKSITNITEHNAKNQEERQRIEALGGSFRDGRVEGLLAVTRAFGDYAFKLENDKQYVICKPSIDYHEITSDCEFAILCSDGALYNISPQGCVDDITLYIIFFNTSFVPPTQAPQRIGSSACDSLERHSLVTIPERLSAYSNSKEHSIKSSSLRRSDSNNSHKSNHSHISLSNNTMSLSNSRENSSKHLRSSDSNHSLFLHRNNSASTSQDNNVSTPSIINNNNNISDNTKNISDNNKNISDNTKNISDNTKNISDNTKKISDNTNNISDNTNNISDNNNNSLNMSLNTEEPTPLPSIPIISDIPAGVLISVEHSSSSSLSTRSTSASIQFPIHTPSPYSPKQSPSPLNRTHYASTASSIPSSRSNTNSISNSISNSLPHTSSYIHTSSQQNPIRTNSVGNKTENNFFSFNRDSQRRHSSISSQTNETSHNNSSNSSRSSSFSQTNPIRRMLSLKKQWDTEILFDNQNINSINEPLCKS
ncbi:hypothetical protein WA158_003794 [Blastocystis sp. Blastoise]